MKQENRIDRDLEYAWKKVGNYLRQASNEVAFELGGEELVSQIIELSGDPEESLPNPASLAYMKMMFPGSEVVIIERFEQIHEASLRTGGNVVTRLFRHG